MRTYTINGQPADRYEVMEHWLRYTYAHEINDAGLIFATAMANVDGKYKAKQCRDWMREAGIEIKEV